MFNSFRQLISDDQSDNQNTDTAQTPTRQGPISVLNEFTPIGSRSESMNPPTLQFDKANLSNRKMSDQSQKRIPKMRDSFAPSSNVTSQQDTEMLRNFRKQSKPLHRMRIDNNGYESATSASAAEVSDAETEHNVRQSGLFGRSIIRNGSNVLPNFDIERRAENEITDGEESNMVKKQTEALQRLKTENMNLKVELTTLWNLPRDHGKLAQQIVNLNQQLLSVRQENVKLKEQGHPGDVSNHLNELNELKDHVEELEDVLKQKETLYEAVRDEKDDLIQEKLKMTDEIDILNNKIDQYEIKVREMINEKAHDDSDSESISQLKFQNQQLESTIGSLEKEIDSLTDDNHELRANIDRLEREIHEGPNTEKVNELEKHVSELQVKVDDLNEVVDDRERKLNTLRTNEKSLQNEKQQLELKIDVLEARNATTSMSKDPNNKKLNEMTNRLVEASESIDQLSVDLDHKENIIKDLSSTVKELNSRLDTLMDENEDLHSIVNRFTESKPKRNSDFLSDSTDDNLLKMKNIEEENLSLKSTLEKLKTKLDNLDTKSIDNQYLNDLESDRDALNEALQHANDDLDREISIRKQLERKLNDEDISLGLEDIEKLKNKIQDERSDFNEEIEKFSNIIKTLVKERNDAFDELDRLEEEKLNLINEFETIQRGYQTLVKGQEEKEYSIDVLKQDFENLSIRYKKEYDSHEETKRLLNNEIQLLESANENKEKELAKVRTELISSLNNSSNNSKTLKLIEELSSKAKTLVEEKEDLTKQKSELSKQLNTSTNEADILRNKLKINQDIISELETGLEELNKEKRLLKKQLSVKSDDIGDLILAIETLRTENSHVFSGMDDIISKENEMFKNNEQIVESIKSAGDRQVEFKKLQQQLKKSYEDYNNLRNTLFGKIESIRDERDATKRSLQAAHDEMRRLKTKNEQIEKKMATLEESLNAEKAEKENLEQQLQHNSELLSKQKEWFPLTPVSPSKESDKLISNLKSHLEISELQKKLIGLKLQERSEHYDDQKYQNKYMQLEIGTKNDIIRRSYKLINESGIEVPFDQKLTSFSSRSKLRIAFLIVLASVRMKNRSKALQKRKNEIIALKKEIVKKRYQLDNI